MEIYPRTQAQMLLCAFALGLGAGLFRQVILALRTVLGAYVPPAHMQKAYERPLPLLHRPIGVTNRRTRRTWRFLTSFAGDLFFCLACALALLLVLYDYNYGAWRTSVAVVFLLGLALFWLGTARLFSRLNDWLAYVISALLLYVRVLAALPLKGIAALAWRFCVRPLVKWIKKRYKGHLQRVSERLCRAQLALAACGSIEKGKEDVRCRRKGSHQCNGSSES